MRLFENHGDVENSAQYGIGVSGDIAGDVHASISVSSTSLSTSNQQFSDSHNVYSQANYSDSHDSYSTSTSYTSNVDSHDSYTTNMTYIDSHDTHNNYRFDNVSFTSTKQAAVFGVFFGNGDALRLSAVFLLLVGVATYVFLEEILLALAVAGALATVGTAGVILFKAQRNAKRQQLAYCAYQEQQAVQRQFLQEQREHELRLAKLSRPVYIVTNRATDAAQTLHLLEERASGEPIEILAQPKVYARRLQ